MIYKVPGGRHWPKGHPPLGDQGKMTSTPRASGSVRIKNRPREKADEFRVPFQVGTSGMSTPHRRRLPPLALTDVHKRPPDRGSLWLPLPPQTHLSTLPSPQEIPVNSDLRRLHADDPRPLQMKKLKPREARHSCRAVPSSTLFPLPLSGIKTLKKT